MHLHGCCSFSNALAVPQLAEACIQVLTPVDAFADSESLQKIEGTCEFRSGIKVLRLVCKGARDGVQRMITGIMVPIGMDNEHCATSFVKFLQPISLQWFVILLTDDSAGELMVTG